MIHISKLNKSFDKQVLRDVALQIKEGTTLALIGPSGCGKSTLLRIVMGLVEADSGSVIVSDADLSNSDIQAYRRRIGYVIQNGGLFPHLTANENITLVSEYLGWDRSDQKKRIHELCELTNIDPGLLDRKPDQLSGGQAQRVSLMRALMLDPPVLLMDEPLGSIDPMIRHGLQSDLKKIFRQLKKTVLLVTHDLGEATFLGDRIALMRDGEIVQTGTCRELKNEPANSFVSTFVEAQRNPALEEDHGPV